MTQRAVSLSQCAPDVVGQSASLLQTASCDVPVALMQTRRAICESDVMEQNSVELQFWKKGPELVRLQLPAAVTQSFVSGQHSCPAPLQSLPVAQAIGVGVHVSHSGVFAPGRKAGVAHWPSRLQ